MSKLHLNNYIKNGAIPFYDGAEMWQTCLQYILNDASKLLKNKLLLLTNSWDYSDLIDPEQYDDDLKEEDILASVLLRLVFNTDEIDRGDFTKEEIFGLQCELLIKYHDDADIECIEDAIKDIEKNL